LVKIALFEQDGLVGWHTGTQLLPQTNLL
jgi:hypothetical protein